MTMKFIAEISGNHNGSLSRALELVRAAAAAGATHLKLQTYSPESLTLDLDIDEYRVGESHPLWPGRKLFDLYQKAQTPREWHSEIFGLALSLNMIPFSTPFDEGAADFLESLGVGLYKIASLEIVDIPLIQHVASTHKPLIISTGAATLDEVDDAVDAALGAGCTDLTLLVCTSDYPALAQDANLKRIPFLQDRYNCEVGLSDHSLGSHVAVAATAIGATVVEKHICIERDDGGVDSGFSATPREFADLVKFSSEAFLAVGDSNAWGLESEDQSRRHRPSIIVNKDILAGQKITLDNVATLRPNVGLAPKHLSSVLGRLATRDLSRGDGLKLSDLE